MPQRTPTPRTAGVKAWSVVALAVASALPMAAGAQTTLEQPAGQASSPAEPTVASTPALSPICTDRPTKSTYACTVDAGHVQYESDILNASFLRLNGTTTDTYLVVNPTLKYGLTSNVDIEANLSPLEIVRTRDASGRDRAIEGISDLYLRLKYEVLDVQDGTLQATILPYVKAPTARPGVGDGVVEGGVILPVNYKLTKILTLTVDPEVDVLKDATGGGRHVNTAELINLAVSLPRHVALYGELWSDWNFDPAGVVKQYSADAAVAYGVTSYLQVDAGLNFGLNRYTPGVQAYVGVSQKF